MDWWTDGRRRLAAASCACGLLSALAQGGAAQAAEPLPDTARMQQIVARASEHGAPWDGPASGPRARADITLAIVSEDLRNGGILGVAKGIKEAARVIGWKAHVYDAGGTPEGRRRAVASALALQPGGVVLVGGDAREMRPALAPFAQRGIPVVGWHVAEPLNLQGWQLVDELNRLLAGQPVSGYVSPVHLVTAGNIAFDGGPLGQYDPDSGYRAVYRRIWGR